LSISYDIDVIRYQWSFSIMQDILSSLLLIHFTPIMWSVNLLIAWRTSKDQLSSVFSIMTSIEHAIFQNLSSLHRPIRYALLKMLKPSAKLEQNWSTLYIATPISAPMIHMRLFGVKQEAVSGTQLPLAIGEAARS